MVNSSATPFFPGPYPENLYLTVHGVSQNSSDYNVSLSILNQGPSLERLDKITLGGKSASTDVNGTVIIDPSQMSYGLKSGDTLQVNLMTPTANYEPNATAAITVYTSQAMYYVETNMP
jgi:hypothetical protein